jgi:DNA-binding beta-propeller fold protein YncE
VFVADAPNQQFVTLTRRTTGQYALASPQLKVPGAFSVTIAPDSTTAWVVAGTTPESVTIVDIPSLTGTSVSTLQSYVNLRGLALSPDGRYLFGADASAAALRILDPRSLRVLQTTPLAADVSQAEGASSLAVAPGGSSLFVANRTSGTLSVLQQYSM